MPAYLPTASSHAFCHDPLRCRRVIELTGNAKLGLWVFACMIKLSTAHSIKFHTYHDGFA